MRIVDLRVPEIGGFASVIQLPVRPGDAVTQYTPIVTLETEEATFEVPARFAGTVCDVKVKLGDTVTEGTALASISVAEGTTSTAAVGANAHRSSAENPLRVAILIAFIGGTLWALAPLVVASLFGDDRNVTAMGFQRLSYHDFSGVMAWGALVVRTIQNEIAVAAVTAVAWVLAVMVKAKRNA